MSLESQVPNSNSYQTERDDLTKVLALMDEYLAKLRSAQGGIEQVDFRRASIGLLNLVLVLGSGGGLIWTLVMEKDVFLRILWGSLSILALAASISSLIWSLQQENRFKRELQVTEKLLERLIRLASQTAEHQKLDMTQRLELELRLAETESALERASSRTAPELTTLVRDAIHQVSKV